MLEILKTMKIVKREKENILILKIIKAIWKRRGMKDRKIRP